MKYVFLFCFAVFLGWAESFDPDDLLQTASDDQTSTPPNLNDPKKLMSFADTSSFPKDACTDSDVSRPYKILNGNLTLYFKPSEKPADSAQDLYFLLMQLALFYSSLLRDGQNDVKGIEAFGSDKAEVFIRPEVDFPLKTGFLVGSAIRDYVYTCKNLSAIFVATDKDDHPLATGHFGKNVLKLPLHSA